MKKLILILWLIPFVLSAQTKLTYKTSEVQTLLDKSKNSQAGVFNVLDYGTIQLALDAAVTNNGGIVYIPNGTYNISAVITGVSDNITIEGQNREETIIRLANNANCNVINIGGDGWIVKDLTINGNEANNTSNWPNGIYGSNKKNVIIDNVEVTAMKDGGITLDNTCENWTISNSYLHDMEFGVTSINNTTGYLGSNNVTVNRCRFHNITEVSPVYTQSNNVDSVQFNWNVNNCTFTGIVGYMGVYYNGALNSNVTNCYFNIDEATGASNPACVRYALGASGNISGNQFMGQGGNDDGLCSITIWGCQDITVSNNYFTTGATQRGAGIGIEAHTNGHDTYNITVINNNFYNVGTGIAGEAAYGISLKAETTYTLSKVNINGNNFYDSRGASAHTLYAVGILTSTGTVKDVSISNNIIEGMLTAGIYLSSSADNFNISNNTFIDLPIGVVADDGDDLAIIGNKFVSCITPIDINDVDVTRSFIESNNWYGSTNDPAYGGAINTKWGTNIGKDGSSFTATASATDYKNFFTFHIMNGNAADTTAIEDSTILGSFYNAGSNTLVIDTLRAIMKRGKNLSDTLAFNIRWGKDMYDGGANKLINTQFNCGRTGTAVYTMLTTGNFFTAFDNPSIPPGVTVYGTIPYYPTTGRKPVYFEVSAIGHYRGETVTDYDGNVYTTVTIGTQTWLKENLKTTHYKDGTAITNVTNNTTWYGLTTEAYCWYGNDIAYKNPYGALYNWYAVTDAHGLCPTGYHVPDVTELGTLVTNAGANPGIHLREDMAVHWTADVADNTTGFTLLGAGMRNASDGVFYFTKTYTSLWSTNEGDATNAYHRKTEEDLTTFAQDIWRKVSGYSVRCLKD